MSSSLDPVQRWHTLLKAILVAGMCWGGLLAQGCSDNPDGFELSGFSTEQASTIRAAADEWCTATEGASCPTLSGGNNELIGVDTLDAERGDGDASTIGLAIHRADGTDIYLVRALPLDTLRIVALHEFGHHFGCGDAENGTVMDADIEDTSESHLTEPVLACATR